MVIDMTIDEAIAHAREVANEQKRRSGICVQNNSECDKFSACLKCSKEHEQLAEWLTQLKEYQQLEEQGRLVVLPCKVGDIVFYISGKIILEYEVVGFSVDGTGAWLIYGEHHVDENDKTYSYNFEVDKIGKTVFLTREEAKAKLKELRGEENGTMEWQ